MSLPPATSRAALPFTQRLLGAENFDEWFFELTSVILAGEDLTEMATHCAQVETATSMKGLRRAYKLTEWLADNRSTDEAIAKSIRNHVDELIQLEKTSIARSCALVYASLSPTVQRDAAAMVQRDAAAGIRDECAHCIISSLRRKFSSDEQKHATPISVYQRLHTFKFKPHVSLDVNLQAFDKMRTAVEKLEGRPLSDSHLASALLAALPECIAPDLFVWRGAQPSIPYKNMSQLLEQHWPGLVTSTHTTSAQSRSPWLLQCMARQPRPRQRGLTHWHFRPFAMAPASEKATDKRPSYPGAPKAKTPWRIGVATACPQAATRRTPFAKVTPQAANMVTPPAANKVTHQAAHRSTLPAAIQATPAWDKAAIPATPASITALIATTNAAVARFVSRPPATAVAQATGTATTAKTAGIIATTAAITATAAAPTKTTGATAAAVTRCMPTGATAAAAAARRRSTKATPTRPPPPSAAKAAARRAALPPMATNSMSSAVAQSDSRSLASTMTH
ncbi:hypothetical protein DYB28_014740 [Aphanomyces astaci]|uniref:Uncharacterized protein n=1 Tax=Aphanomyces astaci TaxID=112090 RepID=A0A9X8DQX4_APHAT|nr:hypothetical protein DYB28_014740 [Aphanomyces astaci]